MAAPYRITWRPPAPLAELIEDNPRRPLRVGEHHAPHPLWRPEWPEGSVILGQTEEGRHVCFPPEMRKLGLQIVGLPNQGKSKLMEGMWRQDVVALCGTLRSPIFACPHGSSHHSNLNWLVDSGMDRLRTVRVLDISDPDFIFHTNGAKRREGVDPAINGASCRNAVLKGGWGASGVDPSTQPQTLETLDFAFATVAEFGWSFADALKLVQEDDAAGLRSYAAQHSENPLVRAFWRKVEARTRPADREPLIGSAERRLNRFLLPRRLRLILSEPDQVIDWRRVMDDGEVVLLNLSFDDRGVIDEDQAVMLGALIMNDIYFACRGRDEHSLKAYLYWDEVHRFVTEAAARLFTESRKFNLHPVFAHQIFDQLDEVSPAIKGAIMSCRNRIFFGGLPPSNAELAARFAFRGQWDFEKPKHLYDKPTVVDQKIAWLRQEGHGTAIAVGEGTNWSRGGSTAINHVTTVSSGSTISAGETASFDADRQPTGSATTSATSTNDGFAETLGIAETSNWSEGGSETTTRTETASRSRGQAFQSVFAVLPTQGYSFPELVELAAAEIANLEQGEAIIKIGTRPAVKARTLRIRDRTVRPEHIQRVKQRLADRTSYVVSVAEATATEERRERELALRIAAAQDHRLGEEMPSVREGWG